MHYLEKNRLRRRAIKNFADMQNFDYVNKLFFAITKTKNFSKIFHVKY